MLQEDQKLESINTAKALCHKISPYKLASRIGAFYTFNGERAQYVPPHSAITFALMNADIASTRNADVHTVSKILDLLKDASYLMNSGNAPRKRNSISKKITRKDFLEPIMTTENMRLASHCIKRSGTEGQMICYALDMYSPHDNHLESLLGFDVASAFAQLRHILVAIEVELERGLKDETVERLLNRKKVPKNVMLKPPKDFLDSWERATNIEVPSRKSQKERSHAEKVLQLISVDLRGIWSQEEFLETWCVVRLPDGKYSLVWPTGTVPTLYSAIHLELMRKMPSDLRGKYGQSRGRIFEDIVADRFRIGISGCSATPRYRMQGQSQDIDVLVELPDSGIIIVQCKSRIQRSRGRLGSRDNFESDIKRNILDGLDQLRSNLATFKNIRNRVISSFLVLDDNFPLACSAIGSNSQIGEALSDLPNPVIIDVFDLEELFIITKDLGIEHYLRWREKILRTRTLTCNEADLARLYLRRDALGIPELIEKLNGDGVDLIWIGDHREFESRTEAMADLRLGIRASRGISEGVDDHSESSYQRSLK